MLSGGWLTPASKFLGAAATIYFNTLYAAQPLLLAQLCWELGYGDSYCVTPTGFNPNLENH